MIRCSLPPQGCPERDTHWSTINPTLYTVCYTGVAASTARCELCFATSHTERECAQRGDPNPGMKNRLKAIETAILAMSSKPPAASKAANVAPCSQAHSGGLPKMEQRPLFIPTVPSHPHVQWLWGTSPSRSMSCLPTGSGSTPWSSSPDGQTFLSCNKTILVRSSRRTRMD